MAAEIELPEIQGNILCAYALPVTRYCLFRFDTPDAGRAFVAAVTPEVTTAEDRRPDGGSWSTDKPESTVNLAFTFAGLGALGLEHAALAGFPLEFQQGCDDAPGSWSTGAAVHPNTGRRCGATMRCMPA